MNESPDISIRKLFLFEGTQDDFEQIQALFESGELSKLLGVPILDVGIVPESQPITASQVRLNLSQWLKEIVEPGWQTMEELFSTQAAISASGVRNAEQPRENDNNNPAISVSRGKLIDLGMQLAGNAVALIVTLTPAEADDEIDIHLRVCPASEQIYLPLPLQLIVLDESGATIPTLEAQAISADKWIQLEFSGKPGERFSVKLAFGDVSITEDFVI